jgi:hypothetical protein
MEKEDVIMKKFCTVLILITMAISQLSFAEDRAVFTTLMNNGFELAEQNKPMYWKSTGPEDAIIWDNQIYQEGKHSVQIVLTKFSGGAQLQQAVEVEAFKRYDFGGVVKTENLVDGFAQIKLTFFDKNGNEIRGFVADIPKLSGTQNWTPTHLWIESPAGADVATIGCFVSGKGKAWFDDIQFTTKIKGGY